MKTCPACGRGQGAEIPDQPGEHYSDIVFVEIRGVRDGGLFWLCPFCGHKWHRWKPEDGRIYDAARRYVEDPEWVAKF